MKILLLTHAFNGLAQRLYVELDERGHTLSVEFDINDAVTREAVDLFQPDLVIAPFLKRAIPGDSLWPFRLSWRPDMRSRASILLERRLCGCPPHTRWNAPGDTLPGALPAVSRTSLADRGTFRGAGGQRPPPEGATILAGRLWLFFLASLVSALRKGPRPKAPRRLPPLRASSRPRPLQRWRIHSV